MGIVADLSGMFAGVSKRFQADGKYRPRWVDGDEWREVTAMVHPHYRGVHGGEFFAGLHQFLTAMDGYNTDLRSIHKVKFVVDGGQRGDVLRELLHPARAELTLTQLGGIGLSYKGRVHEGRYIRGADGATGFVFGEKKIRFDCEPAASFDQFAHKLLSLPVQTPGPFATLT